MLPKTNSASPPRRSFAVTLSNAGDILFSSVSDTTPNRRSACPSISDTSFFCDPRTSSGDETVRGSLLSLSNSLIDPNIELPNFSASEVEEVLNQFSAPTRNRVGPQSSQFVSEPVGRPSNPPTHRLAYTGSSKTPRKCAVGLSKDDSFTPPPVKRSFAIITRDKTPITSTNLQKPFNCPAPPRLKQNSDSLVENAPGIARERASGSSPLLLLQFKPAERTYPSRLISALQLPVVGASSTTVKTTESLVTSSVPPQGGPTLLRRDKPSLPVVSEHKLPKTFVTLVNATKQRQENLTVRLANRAKLVKSRHVRCNSGQAVPTVNQNGQSQEPDSVTQLIPGNKQFSGDYSSQNSGDRFRFLCPHPRCGRRYQARLGLTRHLVKYHSENVDESMPDSDVVYNGCQIDGADVISGSTATLQVSTTKAAPAAHTSLKLCLPIRAIRVERPSLSLDRSRQRSSSPPPSATPRRTVTSFPGNSLSLVSLCSSAGASSSLARNRSPPFINQRSSCGGGGNGQPASSSSIVTAVGGGERVAVFPLQLSAAAQSSATASAATAGGSVAAAAGSKFFQPKTAETVGGLPSTTTTTSATTTSVLRSMYSRHGSIVQATSAFPPPNESSAGCNGVQASFVDSSPLPMPSHEEDFRSVVLPLGSDWGSVMASDEGKSFDNDAHRRPTDSLPCLRDSYAADEDDDDLPADAYSVSPPRSASVLSRFSAVSPSRSCTDCLSRQFPPSPLVRTASSGSVLDFLTAFGQSNAATYDRHNHHHHHPHSHHHDHDHGRQHAASEFGDQFDDRKSWTDSSAFSSSLGGHHSEYYASDEADHSSCCWRCRRQALSPGSWQCQFAPHALGPPLSSARQRKQRLSVISTDALGQVLSPSSSHCCSSAGGGGGYFSRRRRTVSSGIPASMDTTRSASVVCEKTNYPAAAATPHAAPDVVSNAYCCCSRLGRGGGGANTACCRQHFRSRTLDSESNSERAVNEQASSTGRSSAADLVACPVNDCGLVCAGCESLCEHLKECHLPDSQKKPVRLIFACPVKDCGIFCADEAAFEAHFDAHLDDQPDHLLKGLFRLRTGGQKDSRQSQSHTTASDSQFHDAYCTQAARPSSRKSADTSPQRLLTPRSSLPPNCALFSDSVVKGGDDMLAFMSPTSTTERPSLPAVSSAAATDSAEVTPFDSAHTSPTEGTSPMSISDADGRGLLQALDLLPDDLLDELLQEDRAPLFGSSGGCGSSGFECRPGDLNLRKLSNSSIELAPRVSELTSAGLSDVDIVCSSSSPPGASLALPPNSSPAQSFANGCKLHSLTDPSLSYEDDDDDDREALWCSQLPDLASALILPDAERRLRDTFLLSSGGGGSDGTTSCRQPVAPSDVGRSRPLTPDAQLRTRRGKRQHSCLSCPQRRQQGSELVAAAQQLPSNNSVGSQLSSAAVSCTSAPPSAAAAPHHDNHPAASRPPASASQLLFPKLSSRLSAVVPGREGLNNADPPRSGNTDLFRRPTTQHSRFWLEESEAEDGKEEEEEEGLFGERNPRLFDLQPCACFACPYSRSLTSAHLSDTDMPLISSLGGGGANTADCTELSASRDALWVPHQPQHHQQQRSANRLLKRRRTFLRRPNTGSTPHSSRGGGGGGVSSSTSINPLSPRPYFRP